MVNTHGQHHGQRHGQHHGQHHGQRPWSTPMVNTHGQQMVFTRSYFSTRTKAYHPNQSIHINSCSSSRPSAWRLAVQAKRQHCAPHTGGNVLATLSCVGCPMVSGLSSLALEHVSAVVRHQGSASATPRSPPPKERYSMPWESTTPNWARHTQPVVVSAGRRHTSQSVTELCGSEWSEDDYEKMIIITNSNNTLNI